jgi:hypothetical protein
MAVPAKKAGQAKGPAKGTRATPEARAASRPKTPDAPAAAPPAPPQPAAQPPAAPPQPAAPPAALRLAAAAQAIEAAGLVVAAAFGAASTADGKSSHVASGVALTVIALAVALGIAAIALALVRLRPWSRTPTAMAQLFVIIGGISLLDGDRPEWGVPALLLAAACLAGLLTPASLRALNRPPSR